jgi:WD40 repeat protein
MKVALSVLSVILCMPSYLHAQKLVWQQEIGPETRCVSVAYSPDGKILAAGMVSGLIDFWRVDGNSLSSSNKRLLSHEVLGDLAFSPDGKILATCGGGNAVNGKTPAGIQFWNPSTAEKIAAFGGHGEFVYSIAFSPNGKILASGGADEVVRLWDVDTRTEIASLKGHNGAVFYVTFSPDGKTIASGSSDTTIKVWDVVSQKNTATLKGHTGDVIKVLFSPDGKSLFSGSDDWTVKFWNVADGKNRATLNESGWRYDGKKKRPEIASEDEFESDVKSLALSSDGKILAVGDVRRIYLYDAADGTQTGCYDTKGNSPIHVLVFSSDGNTLISSGDMDGKPLHAWRTGKGVRENAGQSRQGVADERAVRERVSWFKDN